MLVLDPLVTQGMHTRYSGYAVDHSGRVFQPPSPATFLDTLFPLDITEFELDLQIFIANLIYYSDPNLHILDRSSSWLHFCK